MPSAINTPFGTTVQRDAYDQGDEFGAQLRQRQSEAAQARLDQMGMLGRQDSWHRAAIGEQAREFDAGQGLQAALLQARREEIGAERDRYGKQFDYMTGRDRLGDQHWQQDFDAGKASRATADTLGSAQAQMMMQQITQMQADQKRHVAAQNVPAPSDLATAPAEVQSKYTQDLATSDPATAKANYDTAMRERAAGDAEGLKTDLTADLGKLNERDKAWWGHNPTDDDASRVRGEVKSLTERYFAAGLSHQAAAAKARDAVRSSSSHNFKSGWTDDLYRTLGIGF